MEKKTKIKEEKNNTIGTYPKVELAFNHVIVSTTKKETSSLILSPNSITDNRDPFLLDVQTVLAVGPFVKKENGIDLSVGDKVLLDTRKLQARNVIVLTYDVDSESGTLITMANENEFKGKDSYEVLLITDREILLKL